MSLIINKELEKGICSVIEDKGSWTDDIHDSLCKFAESQIKDKNLVELEIFSRAKTIAIYYDSASNGCSVVEHSLANIIDRDISILLEVNQNTENQSSYGKQEAIYELSCLKDMFDECLSKINKAIECAELLKE